MLQFSENIQLYVYLNFFNLIFKKVVDVELRISSVLINKLKKKCISLYTPPINLFYSVKKEMHIIFVKNVNT